MGFRVYGLGCLLGVWFWVRPKVFALDPLGAWAPWHNGIAWLAFFILGLGFRGLGFSVCVCVAFQDLSSLMPESWTNLLLQGSKRGPC